MLQTTQRTILQIAADVGSELQTAYKRAFKRDFGLPPLSIARNQRDRLAAP